MVKKRFNKIKKAINILMLSTLFSTYAINGSSVIAYAEEDATTESSTATSGSEEEQDSSISGADSGNLYSFSTTEQNILLPALKYSMEGQLVNTYATLSSKYGDTGSNYSKLYSDANAVRDEIAKIAPSLGQGSSFASRQYGTDSTIKANTKEEESTDEGAPSADQNISAEENIQYHRSNACSIVPDVPDGTKEDADIVAIQNKACSLAEGYATDYTGYLLNIAGQNKVGSGVNGDNNYRAVGLKGLGGKVTKINSDSEYAPDGYYAKDVVYAPEESGSKKDYPDKSSNSYTGTTGAGKVDWTNKSDNVNSLKKVISSVMYGKIMSEVTRILVVNPELMDGSDKNKAKLEDRLTKALGLEVDDASTSGILFNNTTDWSFAALSANFGMIKSGIGKIGDLFGSSGGEHKGSGIGDFALVLEMYDKYLYTMPATGVDWKTTGATQVKNMSGIETGRQVNKGGEFPGKGVGKRDAVYVALKNKKFASDGYNGLQDYELYNALRIYAGVESGEKKFSKNEDLANTNKAVRDAGAGVISEIANMLTSSDSIKGVISNNSKISSSASITSWIPIYPNSAVIGDGKTTEFGNLEENYLEEIKDYWGKLEEKTSLTETPIKVPDLVKSSRNSPVLASYYLGGLEGEDGTNVDWLTNYRIGVSDNKASTYVDDDIVPLREYMGYYIGNNNKITKISNAQMIEGKKDISAKKYYANALFAMVSREASDGKFADLKLDTKSLNTVGIDSYGNIMVGPTGQVLIPYWQNYTLQEFKTFNKSNKEAGVFTSSALYLNKNLNKTAEDYGKLSNLMEKLWGENEVYVKSRESGANKATVIEKLKGITNDDGAGLGEIIDKGKVISGAGASGDFENAASKLQGISGDEQKKAILGLSLIITAETADEVENFTNNRFYKQGVDNKTFYLAKANGDDLADASSDDTLAKFNAADLLEKIWMLLNVGVFEIIRLTIGQLAISLYTNSLATAGLNSLVNTATIGQSDNYADLIEMIAYIFRWVIGLLILWWIWKMFRGKLSGGTVFKRFILTIGILIIPTVYSGLIDVIMNKPASIVIGNQLKQTSILDMWATTKDAEASNDIYKQKFYGFTDAELNDMLKEKQKDYVIYFRTTEHKKGFNIDEITLDNMPNLSPVDRAKANSVADKSTGATWGENDLVKIAISSYDLKEWALVRMEDKESNATLFQFLSGVSANSANYMTDTAHSIDKYTEYHADMNKYFNKFQKEELGSEDTTSGYSNITASDLFLELFSNLYNNSDLFENLANLSKLLDTELVDGTKISQNTIDEFVSDLARPREARQIIYEGTDYEGKLAPYNKALKLYQDSVKDGKNKNLFSPMTYRLMAELDMKLPENDAFGLEKIIQKLNPYTDFGETTTNGKIYEVNKILINKYLDTYATVRQTVSDPSGDSFKHAEQNALAIEAMFVVNDYFNIKLFPERYEPNSINFDTVIRMVFMPIADFDATDPYAQNVATYVATNFEVGTIIVFLLAVIALTLFGLVYLLLFSGLMMILSLVTYIYNFVIKDGTSSEEQKQTLFGNLAIYGSFALAKLGLMVMFWIMNLIMNNDIAKNGGSSFPFIMIYSLVITGYIAIVFKKLFIPLLKNVLKNPSTLGGDKAQTAFNKTKERGLSGLAKTGIGAALGLGLGASRKGLKFARKIDNATKSEGALGKMVAKPKRYLGNKAKNKLDRMVYNSKLNATDVESLKKLGASKVNAKMRNVGHGAGKIPGSTVKGIGRLLKKPVAPFVLNSFGVAHDGMEAWEKGKINGAKEVMELASDGTSVVAKGITDVSSMAQNLTAQLYSGGDRKEAEGMFKDLRDQGYNPEWISNDEDETDFVFVPKYDLATEAGRSVTFGTMASTLTKQKDAGNAKAERHVDSVSSDLRAYSTVSEEGKNLAYKFDLVSDNKTEALNTLSQEELYELSRDGQFKDYFGIEGRMKVNDMGERPRIMDRDIKFRLKNNVDANEAMAYLNSYHKDWLQNYSTLDVADAMTKTADKQLFTTTQTFSGIDSDVEKGSKQLQDFITSYEKENKGGKGKLPYGAYIQGNSLRFRNGSKQQLAEYQQYVKGLQKHVNSSIMQRATGIGAINSYIQHGSSKGLNIKSINDTMLNNLESSGDRKDILKAEKLREVRDMANATKQQRTVLHLDAGKADGYNNASKIGNIVKSNKSMDSYIKFKNDAVTQMQKNLLSSGSAINEGAVGKEKLTNTVRNLLTVTAPGSSEQKMLHSLQTSIKDGVVNEADINDKFAKVLTSLEGNGKLTTALMSLDNKSVADKDILEILRGSVADLQQEYNSNMKNSLSATEFEKVLNLSQENYNVLRKVVDEETDAKIIGENNTESMISLENFDSKDASKLSKLFDIME